MVLPKRDEQVSFFGDKNINFIVEVFSQIWPKIYTKTIHIFFILSVSKYGFVKSLYFL